MTNPPDPIAKKAIDVSKRGITIDQHTTQNYLFSHNRYQCNENHQRVPGKGKYFNRC